MVKKAGKGPGFNEAQRPFSRPGGPKDGFAGRLAEVINDFESRQAASDVAGVNPDQLGRYVRGASQPAFETVANMAMARGFSLDWVWNGVGSKKIGEGFSAIDPSMVSVPVMDVRAGAGVEQFNSEETPVRSIEVSRAFLLAHGIKPQHARIIFCSGDSMEPTIKDGAPMVVDISDEGRRDKIYVLRRAGGTLVKRLQHLADGKIILHSDNPKYGPDTLPRDEADELQVIGMVGLVLQSL